MGTIGYRPFSENEARAEQASERRTVATRYSGEYAARSTVRNDDEERLKDERYAMSFTKGLPHDEDGMLEEAEHYERFVKEINQQDATDFAAVPRGLGQTNGAGAERAARTVRRATANGGEPPPIGWRGWESPRAGHYFDLQGPDADAVSMPPAPEFDSEELIAEMGEVYALALLRDVPFADLTPDNASTGPGGVSPQQVFGALADLSWFKDTDADTLTLQERRRRAARRLDHGSGFPVNAPPDTVPFDPSDAFRGSGPASKAGPYVSQFMLLGNDVAAGGTSDITESAIYYGVQVIDQKIRTFPPGRDFMLHWNAYVDVQNGADFGAATTLETSRRFIATPRDLAAYVRFDALYQAYLNACLYMLGDGVPFQRPVAHPHTGAIGPGFPDHAADKGKPPFSRQAFATFGGPHVLSLVTEVATRCLKAVRRQKFNYHRRCRPERVGALLTLQGTAGAANDRSGALGTATGNALDRMLNAAHLGPLLALVDQYNQAVAASADPHLDFGAAPDPEWFTTAKNYLLPMAFAEGSPMHPSYGAGHATVAGGCVTMLKAFFDTVDADGNARPWGDRPVVRAHADGSALERLAADPDMTIGGELNKLAANVSIARNMAGVHYYTDYYESMRMGERVAVGILIEQMKQYNEPVEMNFESFDGDHVHILKVDYDYADPRVFVHDAQGEEVPFDDWWHRHQPDETENLAVRFARNASEPDGSRTRSRETSAA